jgi:adenosylmethionine-8-amino-7-oxononanoate aminotransferase
MRTAPPPIPVSRAEGVYLVTPDGRRILDGISSWWVNIYGHNHPRLNRALREQSERLAQVIFAGFTNEPAERLAAALVRRTPAGLSRVFYSDDGSTAVEVALKMAYQYWRIRGDRTRDLFVALENAYHGDTFGAMAVGGSATFHGVFRDLLFPVRHIPGPQDIGESLEALDTLIAREGRRIVAVIVEPMVQGAGGMVLWPVEFLRHVRDVTAEAGIPLIADEVFTGFGRTGTTFACEHGPVSPDIMCLSKALTGGYLPLGATLCTEEIYETFLSEDRSVTFLHGHSFTGNALSCAVALEGLAVFDDENCLEKVARLEAQMARRLHALVGAPRVQDVRGIGAIAAIDLRAEGRGGYFDELGPRLYEEFLSRDILLRPLGHTLYVVPPYVITEDEVERVFDAIVEVVGTLA